MIQLKLRSLKNQSGQVAIVILLIMVVLLTVGLSLASRTTQELFLSQQEAESARVFNAAEVGIDDALSYNFDSISGIEPIEFKDPKTVDYVSTSTTINPNNELETQLTEGSVVHVNLEGYSDTQIKIDWARETNCDDLASLLVSIYYLDGNVTKVVHEVIGPDRSMSGCTNFNDDFNVVTGNDSPYSLSTSLTIPNNSLFARVRAVYNDSAIRISGTTASGFPTQFFTIRSAANTDVGSESRTVEVGRTLSGAPSFMDYSLYSGADITVQAVP